MASFKILELKYQFKGVLYSDKLKDIYNMMQLFKFIWGIFLVDVAECTDEIV